ncbi:hypothetical protein [Neobacillus sp. LXY-4]|uniref:hypothetical protein n=1 Tax=Neobacillus sp. LXY-4 TaxID=3379826 RepID=UPI003EE33024
MKGYVVIMLQLIIWSGYTVIEWLSKHDHPLYNGLMFVIFIYIAFMIGNTLLKSTKKTVAITFFSLILYSSVHFTLTILHAK